MSQHLRAALETGDVALTRQRLQEGASPDTLCADAYSTVPALHWLITHGVEQARAMRGTPYPLVPLLTLLVEKGASLAPYPLTGETLWHAWVWQGPEADRLVSPLVRSLQEPLLEWLKRQAIDPNQPSLSGTTPLALALRKNCTRMAWVLVQQGARFDPEGEADDLLSTLIAALSDTDISRSGPEQSLLDAALRLPTVRWNRPDAQGAYPLEHAVMAHPTLLARLHAAGVDGQVPLSSRARHTLESNAWAGSIEGITTVHQYLDWQLSRRMEDAVDGAELARVTDALHVLRAIQHKNTLSDHLSAPAHANPRPRI